MRSGIPELYQLLYGKRHTVFNCKAFTKPLTQHRDSAKSLPLNSALAVAGSVTLLQHCWGVICHIASRKPNENALVVIMMLTISYYC